MSTAQTGTSIPSRKSFAQVAAAANRPAIPQVKTPNNNTVDSNNTHIQNSEKSQDNGASPAKANGVAPVPLHPAATHQQASANGSLNRMMKETSLDDKSAPASSVDNLGRKDNSDTKSVTSRTTLTLDEKESLRPDDSASMQGAQDEEATSPLDPLHPGVKADASADARAFRDQLYEIDRHEAKRPQLVQHSVPQDSIRPTRPLPGAPIFQTQAAAPQTDSSSGPSNPSGPPPGLIVPPDNKLVEALNSPKDRLFVLKIEQDFIDFIKNSTEVELQLPSTNTFYRLLSHKLAEYYFLGHVYEDSLKAVRIRKLPYTRLAPPLISCEPKSEGATPPPAGSMKIMRRGGEGPRLATFESRPQSSGEQDAMNDSGAEDDKDGQKRVRDKSTLTREERENRYAEVRARIFDGFTEGRSSENDDNINANSKEMSRSSSHSGPKKNNNKRGKRPKDDSFEARSSYTSINGQAYPNHTFMQPPSEGAYFSGLPTYPQYQSVPSPFQQAPQGFQMAGQEYANAGQWMAPQQAYGQSFPMQASMSNYGQYTPGQFESPNNFYSSPNPASQSTPKPQQPTLAGFVPTYPQQHEGTAWMQPNYQGAYGQPGMMSANGNQGAYMMPFGYDPNSGSFGSYGIYNAPQFNPQSQTFIPGGSVGPMQGWQQQSQPPSNYSSPHFQSSSPRKNGQTPSNRTKGSNTPQNQQNQNSSIAKWANPSSLPAKPPPTSSSLSFQMPRHMEQGQPLPSKPSTANESNGRS